MSGPFVIGTDTAEDQDRVFDLVVDFVAMAKQRGISPELAVLAAVAMACQIVASNEQLPFTAAVLLATSDGPIRGTLALGRVDEEGKPS